MNPNDLSREEVLRYSRHVLIPEVGLEGQKKLKAASVLIVGTGGLGSPISLYLAAAGIGRIGLVDFDVVDSSNLQRQIAHSSATVGVLKVESAKQRLLDLNPYIQVDTYNEVFSTANARRISEGYDILVDGTDNFPTRYLLNDLAVLTGRPYVYGSIFRFEAQVSTFDARRGPCYRCLFPEPPAPGTVPSCADGGVFGVLPGTIGTLQATEVIKLILGIGNPLIGRLLLYDALDLNFQEVKLRKNPACRVCGAHPSITELVDYEEFCGVPARDLHAGELPAEFEITPAELAEKLRVDDRLQLIDVRHPVELQISQIPGAKVIQFEHLPEHLNELDREREVILFCRTGARSARAVEILRRAGFTRVKHLKGGINAWVREVASHLFEY